MNEYIVRLLHIVSQLSMKLFGGERIINENQSLTQMPMAIRAEFNCNFFVA